MMKGTGCSYALHLKWASDLAGQGGTLAGGWVADQETNCTSCHLDFGGVSSSDGT